MKKGTCFIVALLAFSVLYFHNFILSGNERILSSPGGDLAHSGFYYDELGFSLLKKGKPPLWNPYVFCGLPLLASLQAAYYYPLRWLSLFMEEGRAINLSLILHFFLGSLFFYFLSRYYKLSHLSSALGGLTFSFSAIFVLHLYAGHEGDLLTMIWLPLLILFLDLTIHRPELSYPLLGGAFLGIQILACHPQHVYYSLLAMAGYILFHFKLSKPKDYYGHLIGRLLLLGGAALGLSAIQIIPSLEMIKHSGRFGQISVSWLGQNSFPPENFLTILFPGFLGDLISGPYLGRWYLWENCLYAGAGTLILGSLAFFNFRERKIYYAAFLIISGLFLAAGKYNPVFPYLIRFFPGFSFFRGQAKFIFLYGFGLSILVSYGLEYLFKFSSSQKLYRFLFVWGIIVLLMAIILISLFSSENIPSLWKKILNFSFKEGERYDGVTPAQFTLEDYRAAYHGLQGNIYITILFLVSTLLAIYLLIKKARWGKIFLLATICLDLWVFGEKYLVSFSPQNTAAKIPAFSFLKNDSSFFRTGELAPELLNHHIYQRLHSVGGYAGNILSRYNLFINLSQGLPLDSMNLALYLKTHSPLMNSLNLKYILSPSFKRVDHPDFRLVYEDGHISIYQNNKFRPRVFLVSEVIRVASDEEALKRMLAPDFDFLKTAVIESKDRIFRPGFTNSLEKESPAIIRYEPQEIEIEARANQETFLVLADLYYPGWQVYLDGRKGRIYPADYIFRGVTIPAGSHKILFRYEPWSYKIGALITMAAIIAVGGAFLRRLFYFA